MSNIINIKFPFSNSANGDFLDTNKDKNSAIKSDLMHLLLTRRGERYYLPEFGTRLMEFLFDPIDDVTKNDIIDDINESCKRFIPKITINDMDIEVDQGERHQVNVTFNFTIQNGVFNETDYMVINL